MKKLLFMITSMNIGGVEKSLLSLLSVIPNDKYDITLLILDKKGGFLEYIPEWVKVEEATWFKEIKPIIMQPPRETVKYYLSNRKYLKMIIFILTYLIDKYFDNRYLYYKNIFKEVPKNLEEYDVSIAYQGPTDVIDYYIAKKVNAKKKISWIHFDVSKFHINTKLYSKLYQKFDKLFVVSREAKNNLVKKIVNIDEKCEVVFNIISKQLIKEMSHRGDSFDDNYDGTKIVTVGRLSYEKGQDIAIKVLYRFKKKGYKVRWYCIGDGRDKDKYKKMIKENNLEDEFLLLGAKSNPYPYIKDADIYVQTSRHEGYCLTLAEAKCLEKPIVTTEFIGACEQIINGKNGVISKCNENELYQNIKSLIENSNQQKQFSYELSREVIDTRDEVYKLLTYIDKGWRDEN